jgi:hypothetical protein
MVAIDLASLISYLCKLTEFVPALHVVALIQQNCPGRFTSVLIQQNCPGRFTSVLIIVLVGTDSPKLSS